MSLLAVMTIEPYLHLCAPLHADVVLVAVIVSALIIGFLVKKLIKGKYSRQTAAEGCLLYLRI